MEIITDNANYWYCAIEKTTHTGGYEHENPHAEDRHYVLFTDWHLKNHVIKAGLKVIEIEYLLEDSKPGSFRWARKLIDLILKKTSLYRMAYPRIRIVAEKLRFSFS